MGKICYGCTRCKNKLVVDERDSDTISKTQIRDLLQPHQPIFWFEYGKIDRLHSDHLLKVLPRSGWTMPEMKLKDLLKYEDYE